MNLGYAFINFNDRAWAERFVQFWRQRGIAESAEDCIKIANVQGWAANVDKLQYGSVLGALDPASKPRVFMRGAEVEFPAPQVWKHMKARSGDWTCSVCRANCFASKPTCFKCGASKPGSAQAGYLLGEGFFYSHESRGTNMQACSKPFGRFGPGR